MRKRIAWNDMKIGEDYFDTNNDFGSKMKLVKRDEANTLFFEPVNMHPLGDMLYRRDKDGLIGFSTNGKNVNNPEENNFHLPDIDE